VLFVNLQMLSYVCETLLSIKNILRVAWHA
jgi:hypothetical protein